MTEAERRKAAKAFSKKWEGKGQEDQDTQSFWDELLQKVFGVETPNEKISYQKRVEIDNHEKRIDGFIKETLTLIEQKSIDKSLTKKYQQSDGEKLTAYEQADRYAKHLMHDENPRWIVTSNFSEFRIYDRNHLGNPPEIIKLKDLEKEYGRLNFLLDKKDERIKREQDLSVDAGEIVGKLYDAFYKQYEIVRTPTADDLKSLNTLCVRLVFCLYAEDAGIFGQKNMFYNYMQQFDAKSMRSELIRLFQILDTKEDERDPFLREDLLAFPYVNGGLFEDENIVIPQFTDEIKTVLLEEASRDFDWAGISPTIFGAVFESTLNPETRKGGGMHFTSVKDIHRVIDPLFLNDLTEELKNVKKAGSTIKVRNAAKKFQNKLSGLRFLDPACGSGNFLTETYLSLRKLENEALKLILDRQIEVREAAAIDPIKVTINQFNGIEINNFAVSVAKTAMWIAEAQTMEETREIMHLGMNFLPLKSKANIVESNALRTDWNEVIPAKDLNYIISNPPFFGSRKMSAQQKADLVYVLKEWKNANSLDYVLGWYNKALDMMDNNINIKAALVSTNSITQGDQVAIAWNNLLKRGAVINYAYRTFVWNSESNKKAHVHCVIIGFAKKSNKEKRIYDDTAVIIANNINPYLIDAENILVKSSAKPICGKIPECRYGSLINDNGYYIFEDDSLSEFLSKEPKAKPYIRPFIGAYEFINRKQRYILYLKGISPTELRNMPEVMKRVRAVQEFRLNSSADATRKSADRPTTFFYDSTCDHQFLVIPRTSSENRRYIPIGFMQPNVVASDATAVVHDADLSMFGILSSNVHMSWMRLVAGRLKSDYRYAPKTVYNTFPWPTLTAAQKSEIEHTAQGILNARALYPDASLADLYDVSAMPQELKNAHDHNNLAVMKAYGFGSKMTEQECVAELMKMYQRLTELKIYDE